VAVYIHTNPRFWFLAKVQLEACFEPKKAVEISSASCLRSGKISITRAHFANIHVPGEDRNFLVAILAPQTPFPMSPKGHLLDSKEEDRCAVGVYVACQWYPMDFAMVFRLREIRYPDLSSLLTYLILLSFTILLSSLVLLLFLKLLNFGYGYICLEIDSTLADNTSPASRFQCFVAF
jgi:hypothetical protein